MTCAKATTASPSFSAMAGISAAMPVMIEVRPATIMATPAPREVARAVMPTAMADRPVPTRSRPAPTPATPTPIRAKAPPRPRIVGSSGVSSAPAVPMTAKAPATVTSPLAMASQLMLPSVTSTGVSTASAAAATSMAAEPPNVPFMKFRPTASSARAPPMVTRLFATASQLMPPMDRMASAMMFSAAPTAIRPAPMVTMFRGIKRMATATSARAPPIASKPLPISARDIRPKSAIAEANIFMAAPISIMAAPVVISPLALPASLVKAVISSRTAPMALSPLTSSPTPIWAKSLQAEASTFIAPASTRTPEAVTTDLPLNLAAFMKSDTSASSTPTPIRPFASPARSSWARSAQAEASILIAAAKTTIWAEPLMMELEPEPSTFAAATRAAISPAMPASPAAICSGSSVAMLFSAEARIRTEEERAIIAVERFIVPRTFRSSFPNTAMAAISSVKSTVMAPRDAVSFSLSIREMVRMDADSTATAAAIFSRALALTSFCQAWKQPFTPSRIPITPSLMLPTLSVTSRKESRNFLMPRAIAPRETPFSRSMTPLKFALLRLSTSAPARPPNTPMMPETRVFAPLKMVWSICRNLLFSRAESIVSAASLTPPPRPLTASMTCPMRVWMRPKSAWKDSRPGAAKASARNPVSRSIPDTTNSSAEATVWATIPKNSPCLAASLMPTRKSPIPAVMVRMPSAREPAPLPRGAKALKIARAPCRTRSSTEKSPLKVRPSLSAVSSERVSRSEKLRRVSVREYSWSAVAGGKISRNASLMGIMTLTRPLAAFQTAWIRFSRPEGRRIFSVNSSMETEPF